MTTFLSPTSSFDPNDDNVVDVVGSQAHRLMAEQRDRLAYSFENPRPGVWCLVGNGLSNQVFIEGPDGIIAIDTGESVQEMAKALEELRAVTDRPIVAVIYTHSHYVGGTQAIVDAEGSVPPIWGHVNIAKNRAETGLDTSPIGGGGLVRQFGVFLPEEGDDAAVSRGLGHFFRNPKHHPHTVGHLPVDQVIEGPTVATIAGLETHLLPAVSDADCSITIWFPELATAINNLMWPAYFNIFPIRGERFRDPSVLLAGLDELATFNAEHMLCCHGPVLSDAAVIADTIVNYRDSIQFVLDQTVRGMNKGLLLDELASFVQLPTTFGNTFYTQQHYGLVEHHVKQAYTGLRGWFDGDDARLFPLPPMDRAQRLVDGFGGVEAVRSQIDEAVESDDLRWALELATWLIRLTPADDGRADGGDPADRKRLAELHRTIARRTTSGNIRNWCLTRARELDGTTPMDRFRTHRFSRGMVASLPPVASVEALRVTLDPNACPTAPETLAWHFDDGSTAALCQRNGVAAIVDPATADVSLTISHAAWADVISGRISLDDAVTAGTAETTDIEFAMKFLDRFDIAR